MADLFDHALERGVIGAVVAGAPWPDLEADAFHSPYNMNLWRLLAALGREGVPVDATVLGERVARSPDPERFGGLVYVLTLIDAAPPGASLPYYAGRVRDLATARRALSIGHDLVNDAPAVTGPAELAALLSGALESLAALAGREATLAAFRTVYPARAPAPTNDQRAVAK